VESVVGPATRPPLLPAPKTPRRARCRRHAHLAGLGRLQRRRLRAPRPKAMSPHTAHPPNPPPRRPPPRESDGPSCSLASTTCCRCSVPPVAAR
jgi:hypothetical protein